MAKVFISYRRADSAAFSGRIYDHLVAKLGRKNVVKDVDDIPVGVDFADYIQNALRQCSVELVIIGPEWLSSSGPNGLRGIDDPTDVVRVEVETAFALGLTVIPILVDNATMPPAASLPASLQRLSRINALNVRHDPDFARDVDRVIAAVQRAPQRSAAKRRTPAQTPVAAGQSASPAPNVPARAPEAFVPARAASGATGAPPATGRTRIPKGLPLAGLAALLVVAAMVGLFSQGVLGSGKSGDRTPTTQATNTTVGSPTATRVTISLPYHASAPGPCDKGPAPWTTPAGWNPQTGCQGGALNLASSAATMLNVPDVEAFPVRFTVSVQVKNVVADAFGSPYDSSSAEFSVTTDEGTYGFSLFKGTYAAFAKVGGDLSYQNTGNLAANGTLTLTVRPGLVIYAVNSQQVTSTDLEPAGPGTHTVNLAVNGPSAAATYFNFSLASAA